MKRILIVLVLFVSAYGNAQEANFVQNEVLVKLVDGINATRVIAELNSIPIIDSKLVSKPLNIWLLRLAPSVISETEAIDALYQSNTVLVAQKNHKVTTRSTIPDDVLFDNQWQYLQDSDGDIDADLAWDVTTGGQTLNGNVIVAAILDDGHDISHEDFEDNIWTNEAEIPDNGIDDDNNSYIDDFQGWSIVTNTDDISGGGHGTPVAGIVGAKGNNNIGVAGVNWDVKLMIIKNDFNTNEADVIAAYSYALESRVLYNQTNGAEGAFIVSTNASWGVDFGNPDDAPLWCQLYDKLGQQGILSCGATINGNQNVDVIGDLPTACPSEYMIAVTNTNINDVKVTSAGFGLETIDLGAPGSGAFTTADNNGYGGFGGTSGATPHVTGAIALLYSAPCQVLADLADTDPSRAAQIVRDLILDNVDPNPSLEGITTTGGRLNVNNAMQALMDNCDTLLSTNEFETDPAFVSLYPNPSKGMVSISNRNNTSLENVSVYSLDGRLIKDLNTITNGTVDISDIANGAYVFKISFKGSANTYNKIVVKE